ncbi:hypothetical protein PV334_35295 [Streptomyces sp. ME02-7008A-1]|uniref:hypothetical protein n=1 Tax=unclassified Streptomyces TaxID=2593676 RepID=UPI0029A4AAB2|nr:MULTISPECIES: hypothetical protein [unclassified Streptomyces]MDX3186474.1 hypothetical protein [Streptomyces sp. ME02-7008A-1]MDX3307121.1 hypothetical protein [Streptomyces sp. ME02-7008A]
METEILVGLIGLGGALVGASATFAGVVYQQRRQDLSARRLHRQTQAAGAADTILSDLYELQRVARQGNDGLTESERAERYRGQHDAVARIVLNVQRIPDAELRSRLQQNAFFVLLNPPEDTRPEMERRESTLWLCVDSIESLGAYLRNEPAPGRNSAVRELRIRFAGFLDSTFFLQS